MLLINGSDSCASEILSYLCNVYNFRHIATVIYELHFSCFGKTINVPIYPLNITSMFSIIGPNINIQILNKLKSKLS